MANKPLSMTPTGWFQFGAGVVFKRDAIEITPKTNCANCGAPRTERPTCIYCGTNY